MHLYKRTTQPVQVVRVLTLAVAFVGRWACADSTAAAQMLAMRMARMVLGAIQRQKWQPTFELSSPEPTLLAVKEGG